jgi:uncharacterized protein HemX
VAGVELIGCSPAPARRSPAPTTQPTQTGTTLRSSNVLLAYFSLAGENYYYGGRQQLTVGNTAVSAEAQDLKASRSVRLTSWLLVTGRGHGPLTIGQ